MSDGPVIIVGAGHGGYQVAASLRQAGFSGRVCLINDEAHLPYQRPPLSKAYIKGSAGPESLMFRPEKFYHDQNIELIAGRAASIDRAGHKVHLASGEALGYGHLVLATGARNRLLDLPNANLPDVKYLRILDESEALRAIMPSKTRAVIIGAGFIGLEFAATARIKGLEVDVLELAPRVMARAVTAEVSEYFQERHREAGIRIHLGVQATSIEAEGGKVTGVSLSDGRHLPADLVVVGVGVLPNIELAAEAGLPVAAGIIVDEYLATADPDISAIGDCALFASPRFGGSLRLESVQNATDHARCLAARLTGDKKPYDGHPWFWSDQGDDKLQIAGLTTGYDRVVLRGSPANKAFSAFCYKGDRLLGIESINRAGDHMFGRRLQAMDRSITPQQAADESFDLKSALA
ncbi:pyridine nucleotide-disulfide oxidoreductase [Bradyrhizobium sp. WBOS7]|uniref:Pyridine nucleotide-disulfide oxidoreductase n=1 Tax=Bradyrhizobium betae TaxID=244734 RepID=A0AAE9ND01_9BRAD|nr:MULTISPECIES: FAD-dependent oxidoreductase [Bradyrhizobium]MDD1569623.1 pyridine nucleotide-disulfide oxidoreductase [Bradyrhizobium sp. WBOS1]UUO35882.1 pyridine nucleotide-disulfide oxidoreductase [Bradyrhizobium sp. WBOS01]MDD1526312.1 pyridine nucleotide-disulfide oxidoreductase [Bradyrhizobium sp. WBOS2]MDD1575722.1 pyridine nucleotide-disulfide oxidoreductase [Bradyrhizobium sp. WBOS7]MDD1599689.1 pyridine nucleotide-disulfide oxidoreductase [Bradyrhizobium sp. WBOS16]